MSERSVRRAHQRAVTRSSRRRRIAGRAGIAAGAAIAVAAPAADAATITVQNKDDAGAGSLRDAVATANGTPADDTIVFASSVTGEIRLTTGEIQIDVDGNTGSPVSGDLAIDGPGQAALTLSGDVDNNNNSNNGDTQVFVAYGMGDFAIEGLTFTDSFSPGQTIDFMGTPKYVGNDGGAVSADVDSATITDSTFSGNASTKYGGGLSVESDTVDLSGLTISGNRSAEGGGGLEVGGVGTVETSVVSGNTAGLQVGAKYADPSAAGGGVAASGVPAGELTLEGIEVSGNTASYALGAAGRGGGIAAQGAAGSVTISDSTIADNNAASGGGIWSASYGAQVLQIEDTTIADNTGTTGAGGIEGGGALARNSVVGNTTSGIGAGGIGAGFSTPLEIRASTIAGNTSGDGVGGVSKTGPEKFVIQNSTVSGNQGKLAGGIRVQDTETPMPISPDAGLKLTNSTVSGNVVTGNSSSALNRRGYGGGVYLAGEAGGDIKNSTIAGNTATAGGGGLFSYAAATNNGTGYTPQERLLSSTIVGDNTTAGAPDDLETNISLNPLVGFSAGFSLIEAPAGAELVSNPAASNKTGVDPQLNPLDDYGGPTQTRRPAKTSPAINAGTANGLVVDQRFKPRTVGGTTDIGSFELNAVAPTPQITAGPTRGPRSPRTPSRSSSRAVPTRRRSSAPSTAGRSASARRRRPSRPSPTDPTCSRSGRPATTVCRPRSAATSASTPRSRARRSRPRRHRRSRAARSSSRSRPAPVRTWTPRARAKSRSAPTASS